MVFVHNIVNIFIITDNANCIQKMRFSKPNIISVNTYFSELILRIIHKYNFTFSDLFVFLYKY